MLEETDSDLIWWPRRIPEAVELLKPGPKFGGFRNRAPWGIRNALFGNEGLKLDPTIPWIRLPMIVFAPPDLVRDPVRERPASPLRLIPELTPHTRPWWNFKLGATNGTGPSFPSSFYLTHGGVSEFGG
jgi:hypothetical protein